MLKIVKMRWNNMFSYGSDNEIDFTQNPVTQIVGLNGSGKSSIPMILEELLFNKNSRGTKKSSIPNRYLEKGHYSGTVEFEKGGHTYVVEVERKSSSKVKLTKDGEDISSHTATSTYKDIENIIGDDFTVFSKKMYQGMTSSLKFLTDTDSNRKKFLISLLNLGEYAPYEQTLKEISSELNGELRALESSLKDLENWLEESNKVERTKRELVEEVEIPNSLEEEIQEKRLQVKNIEQLKNAYSKYKKLVEEKNKLEDWLENTECPVGAYEEIEGLESSIDDIKKRSYPHKHNINKLKTLEGASECPTCEQALNTKQIDTIITEARNKVAEYDEKEKDLSKRLSEAKRAEKETDAYFREVERNKERLESIQGVLSDNVPEEPPCEDGISSKIKELENKLSEYKIAQKEAREANVAASAHNARVEEIESHISSISSKLTSTKTKLTNISNERAIVQTLQKAFSTTGIVAYKLESMVKDLENLINEYLVEFSSGQFFLNFVLNGDKLNVVITADGEPVSMAELSSGEQTRVNISTILAVRKIMNSLSNQSTNLLVLDEVVSLIDSEGRKDMVEILLKERDLNTFIISHGWSHPLVPRLLVEKTNGVSRITDDG